jgi:uncharacterized surface protein with fasciclin (FAS1) repeats
MAMLGTIGFAAEEAEETTEKAAENKIPDIVATMAKTPDLAVLAKAVKTAGLEETLKGKGPFTIFAPSDAAWAKLPEWVQKGKLDPKNDEGKEQLQTLLLKHVADGALKAKDVVAKDKIVMKEGPAIVVKVKDEKVTLDPEAYNISLVKTDIMCGNGVIHIIDVVRVGKE